MSVNLAVFMRRARTAVVLGLALPASFLLGVGPAQASVDPGDGLENQYPAELSAQGLPCSIGVSCGEIVNVSWSECATHVYGGWPPSSGAPRATLYPGKSSTTFFKDTDGMNGDDACRWYRIVPASGSTERYYLEITAGNYKINDATKMLVMGKRR